LTLGCTWWSERGKNKRTGKRGRAWAPSLSDGGKKCKWPAGWRLNLWVQIERGGQSKSQTLRKMVRPPRQESITRKKEREKKLPVLRAPKGGEKWQTVAVQKEHMKKTLGPRKTPNSSRANLNWALSQLYNVFNGKRGKTHSNRTRILGSWQKGSWGKGKQTNR